MEILESEKDLRSIELGLPQGELLSLNVQHQITSTDVLHDEVDASLSLETRV